MRVRTHRTTQTLVNLVKVYLGSGILGLPYAFREGGLLVRAAFWCPLLSTPWGSAKR